MSYIGQRPVVGRYIKLDQISSGFNGSNTGFSMTAGSQAVFPGTARNLLLSLGGVIQEPDTDFTISGSTLTFTTPPVANTTFFGVIYGDMQATGTPSDGTVLPASIASSGNFSFPQLTVTSSASLLGGAVFNENGADVDFRVEGDTDTHLLVADASSDKVAIGVNPSSQAFAGKFHVKLSADKHIVYSDTQGEVGNVPCIISINDSSVIGDLGLRANHLNFAAGTGAQSAAQKMTIDDTGVAIGTGNIDAAAFFHIKCGTDKNIHYSGGIGEIGNVAGFQTVNDASNTLTGFGIRASEMNFAIGSSTIFRLHTDGNVGINDSSPRAELSVAAVSGNAPHIDIGQASSNNFKLGYDSGNCFLGAAASAGQFIFKNNVNSDGHPQASGTERMRITSAGKVGIGTTSPTEELTISSATPAVKLEDTDQANSYVQFSAGNGDLFLSANGASSQGQFILRSGNGGSFTERMRINASGNVGIGTSSPAAMLHLSGTSPFIRFTDTVDSSHYAHIGHADTSVFVLDADAANAHADSGIEFKVDNSSVMFLKNGGNVGIGTTSPGSLLTLNHATNPAIQFQDSGTKVASINAEGSGTNIASFEGKALVFATSTSSSFSERMRIDTSGRVLIGTSSGTGHSLTGTNNPLLQVESASTNDYGRASFIFNGATAVGPGLWFGKSRGTSVGSNTIVNDGDQIGGFFFHAADGTDKFSRVAAIEVKIDGTPGSNDTPGRIIFATTADGANGTTERLRIDQAGRSLFSGTLGYANIPLSGNPANAAIQIRTTSKYNGIAFGEGAVSGAIGLGGDDTTTAMVFVANAHPANLGGGTKDIFEWHAGTAGGGGPGKYMTLDTSGHLALTQGNLEFASGSGIDFSAVSDGSRSVSTDGNKFDDYEEGTFSLAASGQTVTNSSSRYTKIGRFVHCTGRLDFGSAGLPSNIINMSGLPFTPFSGISNSASGGTIPEHNLGNGAYFMAVESTSVRIRLNGSAITQADVQNKSVRYSFTYQTD